MTPSSMRLVSRLAMALFVTLAVGFALLANGIVVEPRWVSCLLDEGSQQCTKIGTPGADVWMGRDALLLAEREAEARGDIKGALDIAAALWASR